MVLAIKIKNVFTKLSCATAHAFFPLYNRPAIEKKIGAIAEEPRPAKKKPIKANVNARFLLRSTNKVDEINIEIKPGPPSRPAVLIQNRSL